MSAQLKLVPDGPAVVTPMLKWVGGKGWFVKEYGDDMFTHVVSRGGRYIEPFLGGGAMAFYLGLDRMILNDAEEDLMITYTVIRDQPDELEAYLRIVEDAGTDEASYYRVRDAKPDTFIETAVQLIYLNRLGYNGLYRRNQDGGFNVPYGKKEKPMLIDRVRPLSKVLASAELYTGDFTKVIDKAGANDTIYADPPYHGASWVDYTAAGFDDADQERLAESLYNAHQRGADFFCHNNDTEKVRYWYGEWAEIIPTQERRSVNSDGEGRGAVPCLLIAGVHDG
jgi:DNA adenine methylase